MRAPLQIKCTSMGMVEQPFFGAWFRPWACFGVAQGCQFSMVSVGLCYHSFPSFAVPLSICYAFYPWVAGVSALMHPPPVLEVDAYTWSVLGASLAFDGFVLLRTLKVLLARADAALKEDPATAVSRKGMFHTARSLYTYLRSARDPFILAVFLEDLAACSGVALAAGGIGMAHLTGNPQWDALASIAIGGLLGGVAIQLVRTNQRFLLGHAVEPGNSVLA